MTEQEEYVHFVSSIDDLNNAWRLLQEIKQCKSSSLVVATFQFALIEYSKPYRSSRGTIKRHVLKKDLLPHKHIELHRRILAARDQIHAHSDLTVIEAKLYVKNTVYGKIVGTVQNKVYPSEEISNIDAIIDLIEQTLDSMYIEVEQLEAALPFSS